MICRITIQECVISVKELQELAEFLGEDIRATYVYLDKDRGTSYTDYKHGVEVPEEYNPNEVNLSSYKEYVVDLNEFLNRFPKLQVKVSTIPGLANLPNGNITSKMEYLSHKIDNLSGVFDRSVEFNEKCEVHVPNMPLMLVNEVQVKEDLCTESLQDWLDSGWRILAICPQPNQRRPDYVMGRHKG